MTNEEVLKKIIEEKYQNVKAFSEKNKYTLYNGKVDFRKRVIKRQSRKCNKNSGWVKYESRRYATTIWKENLNKGLYFFILKT